MSIQVGRVTKNDACKSESEINQKNDTDNRMMIYFARALYIADILLSLRPPQTIRGPLKQVK
jgi:hypothetical protein